MTEERPVLYVSQPVVAVVAVAILGTLVALATINPGVAIVLVIFAFIFGSEFLEYVTTNLAADGQERSVRTERDDATVGPERPEDDALAVLRRRYANGELTDAEFERRLETLVATETAVDVERYVGRDGRDRPESDADLDREAANGKGGLGRGVAGGDSDPDREVANAERDLERR